MHIHTQWLNKRFDCNLKLQRFEVPIGHRIRSILRSEELLRADSAWSTTMASPTRTYGMVLTAAGRPLERRDLPLREPAAGELLIKVRACGVCRTDLHVVDGELREPKLPLVPGHEIIGHLAALGRGCDLFGV